MYKNIEVLFKRLCWSNVLVQYYRQGKVKRIVKPPVNWQNTLIRLFLQLLIPLQRGKRGRRQHYLAGTISSYSNISYLTTVNSTMYQRTALCSDIFSSAAGSTVVTECISRNIHPACRKQSKHVNSEVVHRSGTVSLPKIPLDHLGYQFLPKQLTQLHTRVLILALVLPVSYN